MKALLLALSFLIVQNTYASAYVPTGIGKNVVQTIRDKWDSASKTYTNYTCSFYWRLDEDLNWVQQPIMQKDAIFGAVDLDTRIVAYITASRMEGEDDSGSIWEHESEFYKGMDDSYKQMGNIHILEKKRVYLANKKALKTKASYFIHGDERYGSEDMQITIVAYHVLHQGYGISFNIMVSKDVENVLDQYGFNIESMFAGLTFVQPNSLK